MIILICMNCGGSHIERDEAKIKRTGRDCFKCKKCKHKFELAKADHRTEHDCFED